MAKKDTRFEIRIDLDTKTRLEEVAKTKGIGASSLARMWVLEKLKVEFELLKK